MLGFTRIIAGYYLEGLAVLGDQVWFSDVIGGGAYCLSGEGEATQYLAGRQWIGGLHICLDGTVLSTGQGGITRLNPTSGEHGWLIDTIDGQRINGVNELVPDRRGGFYFGTVDLDMIVAGRKPRPVGIYHLSASGIVRLVADDLGFTNGMAISRDGRTLYCNESFAGTYVHDIGDDGGLSNRRLFLKKPDCDGMALDAAGNLWITGFSSSHVERVTVNGEVLERLETPAEAITQVRFGGLDMRDLYLTTVPIAAGAGLAEGRLPDEKQSFLLRTRVDTPGYPISALEI